MIIVNALLAALIGAFVGKFLGFVVHYLPLIILEGYEEGREPRDIFRWFFSTPVCPNCQHSIEGAYNIPILGYVLSKEGVLIARN